MCDAFLMHLGADTADRCFTVKLFVSFCFVRNFLQRRWRRTGNFPPHRNPADDHEPACGDNQFRNTGDLSDGGKPL